MQLIHLGRRSDHSCTYFYNILVVKPAFETDRVTNRSNSITIVLNGYQWFISHDRRTHR